MASSQVQPPSSPVASDPSAQAVDDASLSLTVNTSLGAFGADEWDACARTDNPTLSHAFLSSLEDSGCVGADSGWFPSHLSVRGADSALLGVAPVYLKTHSMGEYVFDHGWADAYARAGGEYYPKVQVAVPFTPVSGTRLLLSPTLTAQGMVRVRQALMQGLQTVCENSDASSVHVTFCTQDEWHAFGKAGWLQRTGEQFHWHNDGYRDFADFLDALSANKRKNIKKERKRVRAGGLDIRVLTGDAIEVSHWDAFFRFYGDTAARKWGQPYLNREFFSLIGERMATRIALVMAFDARREHGESGSVATIGAVAGALNFIGENALYGRNWGTIVDVDCLHFECCYYQAMEFAIERGLKRVEAGAQGVHKLQRGYLPRHTYSAHWIRDSALGDAVARYLQYERCHVEDEIAVLNAHTPFKKEGK